MRKTLIALFAATTFALTACGGVSVPAGKVVDKDTSEHEITERDCDTKYKTKTVNGKKKKVKTTKCENEGTGEYETDYKITLEDSEGNDQTHEVSEDEYNSVEVGDQFDTRK